MILRKITEERDLSVLSQAFTEERQKGNRPHVLHAITAQAESLRTQGPGSEDLSGVKEDDLIPFETIDRTTPADLKEHDMGAGSEAKQTLTQEQRLLGQIRIKEAERRINDYETLSQVLQIMPNGARVYAWGHILPPQREIKTDGKTVVRSRPSIIFLKYCPRCGRLNSNREGSAGRCETCHFDIKPHVSAMKSKFPDRFEGVILA